METVEEELAAVVVAAPPRHVDNDLSPPPAAKGKRTKRHGPHSPIHPFHYGHSRRPSPSLSAASTAAAAESAAAATEEEEDTARCLILLSRGHFLHTNETSDQSPKQNHRRQQTSGAGAGSVAAGGVSGGGSYACKTCNRVFASFQALGGHRTSHKKPKNDRRTDPDDDFPSPKKRLPPSLALQLSSGAVAVAVAGGRSAAVRVHECSYCGAEFASGQALGGHMRRHRAGPTSPLPAAPEAKRPRNGLGLDLNFPAPEDEGQRFGYGGGRREKSPEKMVIAAAAAAPALVDCHFLKFEEVDQLFLTH